MVDALVSDLSTHAVALLGVAFPRRFGCGDW
jgi:hypothetical protein